MLRKLAMTLCLAATPAAAFDISAMTDAEREAFRTEIRDYLLENPEVLMEAIDVLKNREAADAAAAEDEMLVAYSEAIFNDGFSFVTGNPEGDVTIVEFLDYQCGYCKRAFPIMEEVIANDGNIRFIIKEFPILGPNSVLGAKYALAARMVAGDDAYHNIHDTLMELKGQLSEAALVRVSEDLSLDHDAIVAKMDDPEVARILQENLRLGEALAIQGTPTFIVGDQFVRGFVEGDQMEALIAQTRSE